MHRWLGLAAGAILVLLAVTGVLINHSPALGLDSANLRQTWLLSLYHSEAAVETRAYRVDRHWLGWANGTLALDGEPVAEVEAAPVGAAATEPVLLAAFPETVVLLTRDGRVVETLGTAALPGEITGLTAGENGGVVVRTPDGCHTAGPGVVSWSPAGCPETWSEPERPPGTVRAALMELDDRPEIPWSRLLLDLHSGRLFGTVGVLVVDVVGLAAIALAITGLFNWLGASSPKRRRRG